MSSTDLDYYQDRMEGIGRYLDHHKPWLVKDPRLVWFAPLWLERLEHPLCIIAVDLQPWALAEGLSSDTRGAVSPAVHLERWTNSTLSALQACFAVPTVIIPNTVLQPPLLQPFLAVLQQHLKAAGVTDIHVPTAAAVQQQYTQHLYQDLSSSDSGSSSCSKVGSQQLAADGAALLQQSCNWLPTAAAAAASAAGADSSSSSSSVVTDTLGGLPLPTRALLGALVDHLQQHFARPEVRGYRSFC
eukprot:GHUV01011442.1.p1 GENE.GHUV01011442.1~~GHUV01011442.1.p1  ORF type:complete len:244 (+),score=77.65 GHUV01011442.1:1454-2185(+)